jgi:hypothetical protein
MLDMRRHLTFANTCSALALAVALTTGTAYAATHLPKNSVASKQVKNHSLKAKDFAAGELLAGPAGPAGTPAVSLFAAVVEGSGGDPATLGPNKGAVSVSDPAGENDAALPYTVTFNRDLTGCVAMATVGAATPSSGYSVGPMAVEVVGSTVRAFSFGTAGTAQDTSFLLAVYC